MLNLYISKDFSYFYIFSSLLLFLFLLISLYFNYCFFKTKENNRANKPSRVLVFNILRVKTRVRARTENFMTYLSTCVIYKVIFKVIKLFSYWTCRPVFSILFVKITVLFLLIICLYFSPVRWHSHYLYTGYCDKYYHASIVELVWRPQKERVPDSNPGWDIFHNKFFTVILNDID